MSEELILKHCSPTLANIKIGNIFNYHYDNKKQLYRDVQVINKTLKEKSLTMLVLKTNNGCALIYVVRLNQLRNQLSNSKIKEFLLTFGYDKTTIPKSLNILSTRLQQQDGFPHEIGVFLGYPLEDVISFIENKGLNYLAVGHWKVYKNKSYCESLFKKYKLCTSTYLQLYNSGIPLKKLLV